LGLVQLKISFIAGQDLLLKHSKTTLYKKAMGTKEKLNVEQRREITKRRTTGQQVCLAINGSTTTRKQNNPIVVLIVLL